MAKRTSDHLQLDLFSSTREGACSNWIFCFLAYGNELLERSPSTTKSQKLLKKKPKLKACPTCPNKPKKIDNTIGPTIAKNNIEPFIKIYDENADVNNREQKKVVLTKLFKDFGIGDDQRQDMRMRLKKLMQLKNQKQKKITQTQIGKNEFFQMMEPSHDRRKFANEVYPFAFEKREHALVFIEFAYLFTAADYWKQTQRKARAGEWDGKKARYRQVAMYYLEQYRYIASKWNYDLRAIEWVQLYYQHLSEENGLINPITDIESYWAFISGQHSNRVHANPNLENQGFEQGEQERGQQVNQASIYLQMSLEENELNQFGASPSKKVKRDETVKKLKGSDFDFFEKYADQQPVCNDHLFQDQGVDELNVSGADDFQNSQIEENEEEKVEERYKVQRKKCLREKAEIKDIEEDDERGWGMHNKLSKPQGVTKLHSRKDAIQIKKKQQERFDHMRTNGIQIEVGSTNAGMHPINYLPELQMQDNNLGFENKPKKKFDRSEATKEKLTNKQSFSGKIQNRQQNAVNNPTDCEIKPAYSPLLNDDYLRYADEFIKFGYTKPQLKWLPFEEPKYGQFQGDEEKSEGIDEGEEGREMELQSFHSNFAFRVTDSDHMINTISSRRILRNSSGARSRRNP